MRSTRKGRYLPRVAAFLLVCVLALAGAITAVAAGGTNTALLGDENSYSSLLSIKLKRSALDGAAGNDDVLADVAASLNEERAQQAVGPTTLAIKLKSSPYHTVTFIEYYVDDEGNIETTDDGSLSAHTYTMEVADLSVAEPRHEVPADRYIDGWFAINPADEGIDISSLGDRVDFSNTPIVEDMTFYGLLRPGYTIYLDANASDAKVGKPPYVTVLRDLSYESNCKGDPQNMTREAVGFNDATARAARVGYDFCGWYWPDLASDGKTQVDTVNGGVLLKNRDGDPVLGLDADNDPTNLTYGEMMTHKGETLYAKWEVAKTVRICLSGAKANGSDAHGDDGLFLWFWPGKGYALTDPVLDQRKAESALIISPSALSLDFGQLPFPQYAAQYFAGWGVPNADPANDNDYLIRSDKEGDVYSFALTDRAFGGDYVDNTGGAMAWVGPAEDDGTGQLECTWDVVYKTAQISVRAPFEVTFKERSDDNATGANELAKMDIDALDGIYSEPFTMDGLSGKAFVESPQEFTNTSRERDVYISSIECVNVGAGAILPGGGTGAAVFSLAESPQGPLGPFPTGGTAINFGYAGSSANMDIDRGRPETWIRLQRVDQETAKERPRVLWYGLDLATSGFDSTKIAFGGAGGSGAGGSYIAKIANVKYTYSVVP